MHQHRLNQELDDYTPQVGKSVRAPTRDPIALEDKPLPDLLEDEPLPDPSPPAPHRFLGEPRGAPVIIENEPNQCGLWDTTQKPFALGGGGGDGGIPRGVGRRPPSTRTHEPLEVLELALVKAIGDSLPEEPSAGSDSYWEDNCESLPDAPTACCDDYWDIDGTRSS